MTMETDIKDTIEIWSGHNGDFDIVALRQQLKGKKGYVIIAGVTVKILFLRRWLDAVLHRVGRTWVNFARFNVEEGGLYSDARIPLGERIVDKYACAATVRMGEIRRMVPPPPKGYFQDGDYDLVRDHPDRDQIGKHLVVEHTQKGVSLRARFADQGRQWRDDVYEVRFV